MVYPIAITQSAAKYHMTWATTITKILGIVVNNINRGKG